MNNPEKNIILNNTCSTINDRYCPSYQNAVSTLTSQGKFHISLGLERVSKVLELLGNPQDTLKVIHVAGTNGKGSTCAMLSSVLAEAGYKTGFYSSPHLVEYTERIKINGTDISKDDFAGLVFKVLETAEKATVHITEFEILTAAAFLYFKDQQVDFAIMETGLGGRLDATNVVKHPVLSIITSIDYDHIDRLGNTIEQIAFEKAGIIKQNVPVITLKNNKGLDVITKVSNDKASDLILTDNTDVYKYEISLSGLWQSLNLSLVLEAVRFLTKSGIFISDQALKTGLKNTSWSARFQIIKDKNLILDGAHNVSGAHLLRKSLDLYFPSEKRIWIYSSLNTKDYHSIINILFRSGDIVICTKSTSVNAVLTDELSRKISETYHDIKVFEAADVARAYGMSVPLNIDGYITIAAGSLYTIGELLSYFYKTDKL